MKRLFCGLVAFIMMFTFLAPVHAELSDFASNESRVVENNLKSLTNKKQEPRLPSVTLNFVDTGEAEPNGIGTIYYYFIITVHFINTHQQEIIQFIDYVSTLAEPVIDIYQEAVRHANLNGGTYVSHSYELEKQVVDNGCWTPDTPWNPFCSKSLNNK